MAAKNLSYEEIIEQARSTWAGKIGDERAESVKKILDTRLENYHQITGIPKNIILIAFEKARNVNTVNFYQESKFPLLENVHVFDTLEDYKKAFPSGKYICPKCEKESTDPYECSQEKCDWNVYGMFGDLGKGIKVIVKDNFLEHPVPMNIFKPIELVTVAP
jgi:hypothetical protein